MSRRWSMLATVAWLAVAFGAPGCRTGSDGDDGTGLPVAPKIEILAGNGQVAPAGERLPDSVVVWGGAVDGVPGPGMAITWSVVGGSGSVGAGMTWTRADGTTKNTWTLGPEVGGQRLKASIGALEVTFIATATAASSGTKSEGP